jgi:hypothetical protein
LIAVIVFYYESDMWEIVTVKLYYGFGEIIYGPQGVDLSNLVQLRKILKEQQKELGRVQPTNWSRHL